MIPNIIWQTHEAEYDDLEPFQKNVINTWKNLNPGWNHMYMSKTARDAYMENIGGFLYNCYSELTGINQADLFKMLVINKSGGFYADMDSVCTMSLNEFAFSLGEGKELVCSSVAFQAKENEINCSNFGGIPNGQNLNKIEEKIVADYTEILNKQEVTLKTLNPGIPTWLAFNEINVANQSTIYFTEDYFIHSELLKVEFDEDYPVNHNGDTIAYSEFVQINNLTI
jgi:hypothetical protein